MDKNFWLERWQQNQIGFHLADVNPRLREHHDVLPRAGRILVPLSGKSVDLWWLAQRGHEVIGVELSELAVRAFFEERGLAPEIEQRGSLIRHRAAGITLYQGDFFALEHAELGEVSGFYDRAALVALPPALRQRYASHLITLTAPSAVGLLVTFDYPQEQRQGPPFAVSDAEVRGLYAQAFALEQLASHDILASEPRFAASGLRALAERVYRMVRHQPALDGGEPAATPTH